MPQHTTTLVPIEAWPYSSPELKDQGRIVNIGLLGEALLYYERVLLEVTDGRQLAEIVRWFIRQERLPDLLALMQDKTITFCGYNYHLTPFNSMDRQTPTIGVMRALTVDPKGNRTAGPVIYAFSDGFKDVIADDHHRNTFRELMLQSFEIGESSELDAGMENALADFEDEERCSMAVQAFVDSLYRLRGERRHPTVKVTLGPIVGHQLTESFVLKPRKQRDINLNLRQLNAMCGANMSFDWGTALLAEAYCNRLISSASKLSADLFLEDPMSILVGDKLYESASTVKLGGIIEELKSEVEFPDVRRLVNEGFLGVGEILELRKSAVKFRDWLQTEAERDRDALFAYHNELGRQTGLAQGTRSALKMFGVLSAGAVGYLIGIGIEKSTGSPQALGTHLLAAGFANVGNYLVDQACSLPQWKPVVFGGWLSERIKNLVSNKTTVN